MNYLSQEAFIANSELLQDTNMPSHNNKFRILAHFTSTKSEIQIMFCAYWDKIMADKLILVMTSDRLKLLLKRLGYYTALQADPQFS